MRRFEQNAAISVYALIDVSASMGFRGEPTRCASPPTSRRACGLDAPRRRCLRPHRLRQRRAPRADVPRDARARQRARDAATPAYLPAGAARCAGSCRSGRADCRAPQARVVISDFYMPTPHIEAVFEALSQPRHRPDHVPLERARAATSVGDTLACRSRDRPAASRRHASALREAWQRRSEARRADFRAIAARYGRKPFEIVDRIDWDRLGAHLMGGGA